MIPAIQEINFGPGTQNSYATLHQATVSLQDMGDRIITTQVRIDGDVVPSFDGWELRFKGERFVLPSNFPQASKDNTTRNSLVDLQFESWAIHELKRYFFFEAASVETGTAIADKYVSPVRMNVENFVANLNKVLSYYFDGKIVADLYLSGTGIYSSEVKLVEIDYSYLWEVIGKVFEVYGVRNRIEYNATTDVYTIKFGYPDVEIDHEFEYGYKGGLLRFERHIDDESVRNILLGRGGEKNLPYRYFKKTDPQNQEWAADPDAIPELANIYFERLRDINFRWYVRGWMHNPNRDTSGDEAWDSGHVFPTYTISSDSPYYWAYQKGLTDEKFSPVEYVKDDESIATYGEHWGALDDNDDIYPTIQGRTVNPYGRIDEVVAVSPIVTDDIAAMSATAAVETSINPLTVSLKWSPRISFELESEQFTIPTGSTGNIKYAWLSGEKFYPSFVGINYDDSVIKAVSVDTGDELPIAGIPAGTYRLKLYLAITIEEPAHSATGTFGIENIVLHTSKQDTDAWKPTFDIWVKDIWGIPRNQDESDSDYSYRVWRPILGDRVGNEAKVVFSTGFMSISEDYEFVIADYPLPDTSKTLTSSDGHTYQSAWRITLRKSDAEYDVTGLYIPNASTNGQPIAGDKFFFTGIDMPFLYVTLAEEDVNTYKATNLNDEAVIKPTWVISLDKVRVNTLEGDEIGQTLAEKLVAGAKLNVTDPRFTDGNVLTLYAQSVTYTWNEPSEGQPYILPDIEVILSDDVISTQSRVDRLESSVAQIGAQYVRESDVESAVRRVATPLFLKKTGESDTSASPTKFGSKVSSTNFRQGGIGGSGWGFYNDNTEAFAEGEESDGISVLELDRLVLRKDMQVNSLVVNQIEYRGGMEIISAASVTISKVVETNDAYVCYFNQKQNSVANNFVVGDIAFGQVFNPDNSSLRDYKCEVTAVDVDRVSLSKTQKYGNGIPQAGDTIVQYGNTSNAARQYVIVRDVVGGGYERMISDLNAFNAAGKEYYFAGRQNSTGDRWFVGDKSANKYAEWLNGELTISGRLAITSQVAKGDGSYVGLTSYLNSLQDQIDGNIQSWASGQASSAQTEPLPKIDGQGQVDPTTANYPASDWTDDTTREKHVGDIYVDDSTGQGYRYTKRTNNGATEYYWVRITDEELAQALADIAALQQDVAGLDYLVAATNQGTLIDGGLVLTSLIQLGQSANNAFNVWSGINGIINNQLINPQKSIAAWYGGEMLEKADWDAMSAADKLLHRYAKSLFRMDGSGYLASGNISWNEDGAGRIPGVEWTNSYVKITSEVKFESGSELIGLADAVRNLSGMFMLEGSGTSASPYRIKALYDFYSVGSVTAGGISVASGGGGGGSAVSWGAESGSTVPLTVDGVSKTLLLSGALSGYATESWVNQRGYLTTQAAAQTYQAKLTPGTDYVVPSALNNYLPVTGGTLAKNSQNILALQNTAANYVVLQMKGSTGQELASWEWNADWGLSLTARNASGTSLGKFGINTDGTPYFANTTDWVQNTLLHAGNYKGTVRLGLRCETNIDGSSDLNNRFDTSVGNYNGNFKYFAYVGHNGSSPNMTAGVHGFPTDSDANALLTIDTFKDPTSLYLYQVGFSSNGSIYYRKGTSTLSNDTWSDPFGGYGLWNRLVSEDYNGDATITRDLTVSRHIAVPQDGTIWLDTTKSFTTSAFFKRGNASDNDYSLYIHAGKDQNSNDARLFLEAGSVHVRKGCNMYFSAFDSAEADPWIGLTGATTGNSRNDFYIANPGYNVYMYAGLYVMQGGNLIPYANGTQSLGGSSNFWGTLYANRWYPDATDTGSYIEYDLANHAFKIVGKMYATGQIAAGGLISNS